MLRSVQREAGSGRVQRWVHTLMPYSFVVEHVPGVSNVVADAMSRAPILQVNATTRRQAAAIAKQAAEGEKTSVVGPEISTEATLEIDAASIASTTTTKELSDPTDVTTARVQQLDVFEKVARARLGAPVSKEGHCFGCGQSDHLLGKCLDAEVQLAKRQFMQHRHDLKIAGSRLKHTGGFYIPREQRRDILFAAHEAPMSGHLGVTKTLARLTRKAWWPGIKGDVETLCKECAICQRAKNKASLKPMMNPPESTVCFERVHMDLVGPITRTDRGHEYVLTVCDAATKWLITRPIPDKSATTIARAFLEAVVLISDAHLVLLLTKERNLRTVSMML